MLENSQQQSARKGPVADLKLAHGPGLSKISEIENSNSNHPPSRQTQGEQLVLDNIPGPLTESNLIMDDGPPKSSKNNKFHQLKNLGNQKPERPHSDIKKKENFDFIGSPDSDWLFGANRMSIQLKIFSTVKETKEIELNYFSLFDEN